MKYWKFWLILAFTITAMAVAHYNQGWSGVLGVSGAVVLFILLYLTRVNRILRVASNTPKGAISSAVMLNARLKPNLNMLQVMQHTRSLGVPQTDENADPATYRWTDPGGAWVNCTFTAGRLTEWHLGRPAGQETTADPVALRSHTTNSDRELAS